MDSRLQNCVRLACYDVLYIFQQLRQSLVILSLQIDLNGGVFQPSPHETNLKHDMRKRKTNHHSQFRVTYTEKSLQFYDPKKLSLSLLTLRLKRTRNGN